MAKKPKGSTLEILKDDANKIAAYTFSVMVVAHHFGNFALVQSLKIKTLVGLLLKDFMKTSVSSKLKSVH